MTNNNKQTNSKTKSSNKKALTAHKFKLEKRDWPIFTLGALALGCWYLVLTTLSSLPYAFIHPYPNMLIQPTFIALLIGIFSSLYVYSVITRKSIRQSVRVIGYIFSVIFVGILLYVALGSGSTCTGLFGVQTDCSSVNYFTVYVLFFNPFVLPIFSILAVVGATMLLIGAKKK